MALKRLKLIAARTRANMSQEELAEALGTTRVSISNWENGESEPSNYFKRALKAFFGLEDITALLRVDAIGSEGHALRPLLIESPSDRGPSPKSLHHFIASHPARHFWQIVHTDYTPEELTAAIVAAIKDMAMTTGDSITRRDALCELASIPLIAMGTRPLLKSSRYEEMLKFCTAALEGCWELFRGSDPTGARHAFECACTYVPLLEVIARDSSKLRKEALELAAQYALLQTMLGWRCVERMECIGYAQHALSLSCESGNILLQLSARTKLSYTCITAKKYAMALSVMQEGESQILDYQKRGHTLPEGAIGNVYSGLSIAQIHNGILPGQVFDIATESTPLDGHPYFMQFTAPMQWWEAAWVCASRGDPKAAMKWLERLIDPEKLIHRPGLEQSGSEQVQTLNVLTDTLLQQRERDMGHIISAWTSAIEQAKALKSDVIYGAAMSNFAAMKTLWPGEDAIRRLMPLTQHW